jgi:RNA polymerase sigma-70 factor (ECF subfamily)
VLLKYRIIQLLINDLHDWSKETRWIIITFCVTFSLLFRQKRRVMLDETALIQTFQSATPSEALASLFEAYADRIYRLALGMLADPVTAEDIVQETFLLALTHRHQFEGRSSLGTWLYRIAYNATQDRLRRQPDYPLPSDEAGDDDEGFIPMPKSFIEWRWSPEEISVDRETRQELERAIHSLPERLRAVFLLRDIEELSTEATAETLGITPGAVKVRLHRARLELRERLSAYFEERSHGES